MVENIQPRHSASLLEYKCIAGLEGTITNYLAEALDFFKRPDDPIVNVKGHLNLSFKLVFEVFRLFFNGPV